MDAPEGVRVAPVLLLDVFLGPTLLCSCRACEFWWSRVQGTLPLVGLCVVYDEHLREQAISCRSTPDLELALQTDLPQVICPLCMPLVPRWFARVRSLAVEGARTRSADDDRHLSVARSAAQESTHPVDPSFDLGFLSHAHQRRDLSLLEDVVFCANRFGCRWRPCL